MDKYYSLNKLKYVNKLIDIGEEYKKRKESYSTINSNLPVSTNDKKKDNKAVYELFCVPIPEITMLINKIQKNSEEIISVIYDLPGIFRNSFFNKCLVNEIKTTNEIENIRTTREDINNALAKIDNKKSKNIRLFSFVKQYSYIMDNNHILLESLTDIRKTYDDLLKDELEEGDYPDGDLFRNGPVYIGTDTEMVHIPKNNEHDIVKQLKDWLSFNKREDIQPIIQAIISHYYFEYIHPFYDGNGRLGRLFLAYDIKQCLDPYTALGVSSVLNINKNRYYKELSEIENKNNYGEITFFVIFMLKIIKQGQENTLETLKQYYEQIDLVYHSLSKQDFDITSKRILFVLFQNYIFSDEKSMEDRELIEVINAKQQKISKKEIKETILRLSNKGILIKTASKPLKHKINKEFYQQLLR